MVPTQTSCLLFPHRSFFNLPLGSIFVQFLIASDPVRVNKSYAKIRPDRRLVFSLTSVLTAVYFVSTWLLCSVKLVQGQFRIYPVVASVLKLNSSNRLLERGRCEPK